MRFLLACLFCVGLAVPAVSQTSDDFRLRPGRVLDDLEVKRPDTRLRAPPGISFRVNTALASLAEGHPLSDKRRRLGVLRHGRSTAMFVEGELLLMGEDERALEAAVKSLSARPGKMLKLTPPRARGSKPIFVQRVLLEAPTPGNGDVFTKISREVPGLFDGLYEVSSPEAFATIETALTAHLNGSVAIGINWVFTPQSLKNEVLVEGFTVSGNGFVNAFNLSYLNSTGAARVGVTDAWHMMKAAGILDGDNFAVPENQVTLAVVDSGFHSDVDVTNPSPNGAPFDTAGVTDCSGGFACPWHGSNVAEIMAARLGNVRSVAGPAGPVAGSVILQSIDGYESWELLGWIAGVVESTASRPRVANMSFSTNVPGFMAWSTAPLDAGIAALGSAGTLVVAASGNAGIDVDAIICPESSLSDCWEAERVIPCELIGVVCVGALRANSTQRAGFSNFGAMPGTAGQDGNTVDIYAPGRLILTGADPQSTTGLVVDANVQSVSGTSEAAPLVAGVVGLIAAADPTLSVPELRDTLLNNASTNENDLPSGAVPDPLLNRWLNAARPVGFTLRSRFSGTDFPPYVSIVDPRPVFGTPIVALGAPVTFVARAVDVEGGVPCCAAAWSVDGTPRPDLVGTTVEITFAENRKYDVSVAITDSGGQTASDTVEVKASP